MTKKSNKSKQTDRPIFICHNSENSSHALALALVLEMKGFPTWVYEIDSPTGTILDYQQVEIINDSSMAMIAVFSLASIAHPQNIISELTLAKARQVKEPSYRILCYVAGVTRSDLLDKISEERVLLGGIAKFIVDPFVLNQDVTMAPDFDLNNAIKTDTFLDKLFFTDLKGVTAISRGQDEITARCDRLRLHWQKQPKKKDDSITVEDENRDATHPRTDGERSSERDNKCDDKLPKISVQKCLIKSVVAVILFIVVLWWLYQRLSQPVNASRVVQDKVLGVSHEAEGGSAGSASVMARSRASGMQTLHLGLRQQTLWSVLISQDGVYELDVLYSNDGPTDAIKVIVDNQDVASFETKQTGIYGDGWNDFLTATCPVGTLSKGKHEIVLRVEQGDETGVEIDMMKLRMAGNNTME